MTGIRLAPYIQIARLTSAELARTPITLLLTGSIAICLLIMPLLMSFSLGEPGKLVRDSSLALTFLGALLLAAASAANALQREVREGTTAIHCDVCTMELEAPCMYHGTHTQFVL